MSAATLAKPAESQTVSGTVSLEACVAPAQTVTFSFSSATQSYFFTRTVLLNADGSYSLPDIPADVYHVKVKGAKWLAAVSDVDTTQGNASLSPSLLTGDANNDNSVDSTDFGLVLSALGGDSSNPASGYDPTCDLDCDGLVDSTDFALLIGDYGAAGDELPAGTALPLSAALLNDPSLCLQYTGIVADVYSELTGAASFGYVSSQPETVRFEDDFTPNAMQTHLILATRNTAHICIREAPSLVAPATVLTAPGTVMYDANMNAAPSGPSPDPYNGIANALHTVDMTLTAGTTYHIVLDFDDTASFETTPDYAMSYNLTAGGVGFNGITAFPACSAPPHKKACDVEPGGFVNAGIASVKNAGQVWPPTNGGKNPFAAMTVQAGGVVDMVALTATNTDIETITYVEPGVLDSTIRLPDTVNYTWSMTGGTAQTVTGKNFKWMAPQTPGHYLITLTVDDLPQPVPTGCTGSTDDAPVPFTFDIKVADPIPANENPVDISQQAVTPSPVEAGQPFLTNLQGLFGGVTGTSGTTGMDGNGAPCVVTGHSWGWSAIVQYRANLTDDWMTVKTAANPQFIQALLNNGANPTAKTDNPTVVTMSTVFTIPGYYQVIVTATDTYTTSNCGVKMQSNTTNVFVQVLPGSKPSVYFDTSLIKVGHGPVSGTQTVTAYVTPFSAAAGMAFSDTKTMEATVMAAAPVQSGNTATIKLTITGLSGTPSTSKTLSGAPIPDCQITTNGIVPPNSATILVLIPTRVSIHHQGFDPPKYEYYEQVGQYVAINSATMPADQNLQFDPLHPAWNIKPAWLATLHIDVWDQFSHNLDSIYTGAEVDEFSTQWNNINSPILTDGTYIDLTGVTGHDIIKVVYTSDDAKSETLKPFDSTKYPLSSIIYPPFSASIRVDGNVLSPAIVNRTISVFAPFYLRIVWPDTP